MGQITSEFIDISPEMASAMLCHNRNNRSVRDSSVNRFANMMKRGEWQATHQGIGFDTNGDLQDGQHRLMAIVRSGVTVRMMVTRDLPPEAFAVMDQGVKRSAADILHVAPAIAELCNFAARVITHEGLPSPQVLQKVHAGLAVYANKLHEACPTKTVYFSSAAMRLGAVVRLLQGEDESFILDLYTKLCRSDVENLPESAKALVRLKLRNEVSAADKAETLARGIHVFTKSKSGAMRAKSVDKIGASELAREVLRRACGF